MQSNVYMCGVEIKLSAEERDVACVCARCAWPWGEACPAPAAFPACWAAIGDNS